MAKTPEQLAEEYATPRFETYDETKGYQKAQRNAFLAGYQAAQEHAHAALEEAEAEIDRLQTKLSDAGILTTEHIVDASKMVDVSSSETLNNSSNNSNGWISVKDRLPEDISEVLIAFGGGVSIACYGGDWRHPVYPMLPLLSVTHWMPLPKPPEEG